MEVTRSHDDRVVRLTIDGGRLDQETANAITQMAGVLREDRDVRVIVLDARTPPFCAGPADDLDRFATDPAAALAQLRPPIVCAIDGVCDSVGLEVALATDIRLATTVASFSLADIHHDAIPAWGGTQRLGRAIRPAEATAMVLTGSHLDAARAHSLGLVHDVVDDLAAATGAMVESLLELSPLALEFTKEAVHRGSELPLRDGLRLEGDLNHQLAATEDRAEGLAAFFEKRPPDFRGS